MLPPAVRALVRSVPTVAPVPNRAILSVTGSQAAEFLNGIIASSVPEHPHSHFYTAFLHAQGRVLYDAFVYAKPSSSGTAGYLIEYDARPSEAPPLLPMLKRYVLRSKVKIRDVSEEYDIWAAWGSDKEEVRETKRKWSHAASGVVEPSWDKSAGWPWGTQPGVLQDRRADGMGHRLLVKKGDRPQEASTHDVVSPEDYVLHRIQMGVPEGVTDIQPMHAFPMESNLDIMGALDFRKGCFVGQELTVRTYHTGILRKRVLPVTIHSPGESSAHKISDAPESPVFPVHLDIHPRILQPSDGAAQRRGRRGAAGKLLSSTQGIGLALLRLEHVRAVEDGAVVSEIEVGDEKAKWELTHWWPDWWPSDATGAKEHNTDA